MLVWRLTRPDHSPALDGEGARLGGGRWNSLGVPMVYCASTLSLAALEYFVHLPSFMRQKGDLPVLETIGIEVPDDSVVSPEEFFSRGPSISALASRTFGDAWIISASTLGIVVPSAAIKREKNILLNPLHPRMPEVKVIVREPFIFDDRLGA